MNVTGPSLLVWDGAIEPFLDSPTVTATGSVALGRFGGSTAHGARKNEDAALIWHGPDWVFATILDAHGGSASATAVLALLAEHRRAIEALLGGHDPARLAQLQVLLMDLLTAPATTARMANVAGETACLIACTQGAHICWLSIGDAMLYLGHPELLALGQHSLTVRNFYEWIGARSSLSGPVPSFSAGIRELRQGRSVVALATDGLLEMDDRRYEQPGAIPSALARRPELTDAVGDLMAEAAENGARDSCTIIAWAVDNPSPGLMPSA